MKLSVERALFLEAVGIAKLATVTGSTAKPALSAVRIIGDRTGLAVEASNTQVNYRRSLPVGDYEKGGRCLVNEAKLRDVLRTLDEDRVDLGLSTDGDDFSVVVPGATLKLKAMPATDLQAFPTVRDGDGRSHHGCHGRKLEPLHRDVLRCTDGL